MSGKCALPTSDIGIEDPTLLNPKCQMSHTKQYIYSLIVSFGCVCAGTVLAWTSSVLPHITGSSSTTEDQISRLPNFSNISNITSEALIQEDTSFQVTDTQAGFVGSIVAIGAVVGALPSGYFVKKMGIKLVLMTMALLFGLGWVGTMFHTLESILLGRFIGGIATGTVCVCVPIYVSEIADVQIRGILGSFFQVSFCFGILLVNLVGGLVVWSDLSYWMIACPFGYFAALTFVPPLRLHHKDHTEDQLKPEIYNRKPNRGFWNMLRMRNNSKSLLVGLGLVTFQQLSGVNAVIFYTGGIFSAAGSTLSANLSTVIVTTTQLVISVVSAMCIEKFNRRLFLLISAAGMSLSLVALSMYFFTKPALPGLVPLVSLISFFFCYCAGYGPLPWLMMGEIFSAEFKSAGCSIATTFNWLLVFGVTSIFPILCSSLGEGYTFLLFAIFNALAMLFTWFRVPETRGKTSEEIQMRFFIADIADFRSKTSQTSQATNDFDWSAPSALKSDDLVLNWDDEEPAADSDGSDEGLKMTARSEEKPEEVPEDEEDADEDKSEQIDIMAQQLKFVACLKILMEELSTLATGFEVDGGQLRYHLYKWLEKEVDALRELCNYSTTELVDPTDLEPSADVDSTETKERPTLHEILIQEKLDFEAKVQRAAKRKRWLRANETLIRTLLSYCSLHGATGGLASVRMELVLLLQELQQEKTHQQLLSPLPFPTSLPLLAASVASSKTVIADPIRYLQCLTHDMLQTVVDLSTPNANQSSLVVLRDLAVALSACIYQSLCDSDTFKSNILQDIQDTSSHLVGRRRRMSMNEAQHIITAPSKWPGVTSLRALLAREKDEDTPRLTVVLCESFIATFLSLLLYGLATCDAVILFHMAGHTFTTTTWGVLFGGGIKKLLRTASISGNGESPQATPTEEFSGWLNKQRVKLNNKILGHQTSVMKEDKPTYREQFIAPEMSMLAYLLTKPECGPQNDEISTDSESEEEDVFDNNPQPIHRTPNNEHSDPNSYSWLILKLAVLRIVQERLTQFLGVAGIEMSELPVASPLIHSALRRLQQWQDQFRNELDNRQSPVEYIPGCFVETTTGPPIQKYRQLLEPHNTPFSNKAGTATVRQLWHYLVFQECVREIFIRAVFGKRRSLSALDDVLPHADQPEPVRIIHKEQDSISAFSLNTVNHGVIVVATPRELQEMDISLLLELPAWLEDDCELDILNLSRDHVDNSVPPFLVIQSIGDKSKDTQPSSPQPGLAGQSGRGASVQIRHKIDGIRRITSHPLLPLYLTGSQDGSVQLWEWGHQSPVATPRSAGTFAKVTRLRFSQHGNKFGVADSDGNLSLWQVGTAANANRPFFTHQCHNKGITDFVFLNSCSLLATAGHSSESKNVCIWDSILPQGKSLVCAFSCHEQGASSMVYAPQHQVLISAGKRGDVCLIDVRVKTIKHRFQAHESPLKCVAIDPHEEYFATGAADGDIKIWGVMVPNLLISLPTEHSRSSFFKNIGQGVTQLHIDSHGRLFSCGADGSMKVRQLPDHDALLHE